MIDAYACRMRPRCTRDQEEDRYAAILQLTGNYAAYNYDEKPRVRHDRCRRKRVITRNHIAACVCVRETSLFFFYSFLSETTTRREVDPYKVTSKAGPATPRRHRRRHRRPRRRSHLLSLALDRETTSVECKGV